MATLEDAKAAYADLSAPEKKKFHEANGLIAMQSLDPPGRGVNDIVWLIVISTLAFVLVAALGALALFVYTGKTADLMVSVVTFVLGVFGGLLAPSPVAKTGQSASR